MNISLYWDFDSNQVNISLYWDFDNVGVKKILLKDFTQKILKLTEGNDFIGTRNLIVVLNFHGADADPGKKAHLEMAEAILGSLGWSVLTVNTGLKNEADKLIAKKLNEWTEDPSNAMGKITIIQTDKFLPSDLEMLKIEGFHVKITVYAKQIGKKQKNASHGTVTIEKMGLTPLV